MDPVSGVVVGQDIIPKKNPMSILNMFLLSITCWGVHESRDLRLERLTDKCASFKLGCNHAVACVCVREGGRPPVYLQALNDHINVRILHSDSKAQDKGDSRKCGLCRVLMFMWSFGPFYLDAL